MLKTNFDYRILQDFYASKPDISSDVAEDWIKYRNFLKSGTDLILTNTSISVLPGFINDLTTGRGNSKLVSKPEPLEFKGNRIPYEYKINETFFLNDTDDKNQSEFRKNNPYFFGFITDHFNDFKKLALLKKEDILSVRDNNAENEFKSWDELEGYLLPFSDCIIIDNYLFSKRNLWGKNIGRILAKLDKSATVDYNLLIITYKGDNNEIEISEILDFLDELQLKGNISVIVTSKIEHDRYIFMNYMRIKSGTTFNYFNQKSEPIVNTEIEFYPYVNPKYYKKSGVILKHIKTCVDIVVTRKNDSEVDGDCYNRLLIFK
jgi:hypothetical protein